MPKINRNKPRRSTAKAKSPKARKVTDTDRFQEGGAIEQEGGAIEILKYNLKSWLLSAKNMAERTYWAGRNLCRLQQERTPKQFLACIQEIEIPLDKALILIQFAQEANRLADSPSHPRPLQETLELIGQLGEPHETIDSDLYADTSMSSEPQEDDIGFIQCTTNMWLLAVSDFINVSRWVGTDLGFAQEDILPAQFLKMGITPDGVSILSRFAQEMDNFINYQLTFGEVFELFGLLNGLLQAQRTERDSLTLNNRGQRIAR